MDTSIPGSEIVRYILEMVSVLHYQNGKHIYRYRARVQAHTVSALPLTAVAPGEVKPGRTGL